jgi:nondiscriminating aspartyl-tRNA synthetase
MSADATEKFNVSIDDINESHIDKNISVYGRVHNIRKSSSKMFFLILRSRLVTLQCVCFQKNMSVENFDLVTKLSTESLIIITGKLIKLPDCTPLIKSCSYQKFELQVFSIDVVNSPVSSLPFVIDDADSLYSEENDRNSVSIPTRLNNRYFDLRVPFNNAIFTLQSGLVTAFREYLLKNGFVEIHSPKILGVSSESGASVFQLKYFDKPGYLAQSPQLYKQMAINADFKKVFEIGPVFRAENSVSHRHLCEFTGMDIELELTPPFNYREIINHLWGVLVHMFEYLESNFSKQITYIKNKHNYVDLKYPTDPLIINFSEGVKLLQEKGFVQSLDEDLSTENEKQLGAIVKELYDSDLFVLVEYPKGARPFYTKQSENGYTRSYDIIMRGQEICSGAQRENDYKTLVSQMESFNLGLEPFTDYLNSFKLGSPPHGGGGFGLERILMLYFCLDNVRVTSLFPRDPSRIRP